MKKSAGILLYKITGGVPYFLLGHPGGPFFKNKDLGSWSIPKGEFDDDEMPLAAAIREFKEETGVQLNGNFTQLVPIRLKSGKTIYAWALECDLDPSIMRSNNFEMEWPLKSKIMQQFPELDKVQWFTISEAREKINPSQFAFIQELICLFK